MAADIDALAEGMERFNDVEANQYWETQGEGVAVSTAYQEVPTGAVSLSELSVYWDSELILHSTGPPVGHGDINIVFSHIHGGHWLSKRHIGGRAWGLRCPPTRRWDFHILRTCPWSALCRAGSKYIRI